MSKAELSYNVPQGKVQALKLFLFQRAIENLSALVSFARIFKSQMVSKGKVVVIVNNNNPVPKLSTSQAKFYYLRRLKRLWPVINKPIIPVESTQSSTVKAIFYGKVLRMHTAEVTSYFKHRQFVQGEYPPHQLATDAEIISYVSQNIGAIAYVNRESLELAKDAVKVILVL